MYFCQRCEHKKQWRYQLRKDDGCSCSWQQGGSCISFIFCHFHSLVSPLVVALERLGHEQLPEVLRGEFLHVLAVVVNLPCWRVATCIHTPPYTNTHTPEHMYINTHTHTQKHLYKHKQAEEGKKKAAQQQISGERSKLTDQNVVRRRRAERRQTVRKRGG
ncbi:hypothetical protein AMECASPLE_013933 [Ameca splendens]|uniref:Uncharacterized protein n=1 Tax=Ameca splendens TaxID=208324 RepID=A0ABV0YNJ3_9TELE